MLDSFILIGAALLIAGLVALANPVLLGWRSRRDAAVALAIAVVLLVAGLAARGF